MEFSEGCSLQLHTQSYQRLFAMKKSAFQILKVQQAAGSSFCFLPQPVVPHETSDFSASNKIFLTDNCSLVWGEVLTCGRKLSGEVFKFSKYQSITEIFINDYFTHIANIQSKNKA
ncbi:MAG: urease accessory protein UreD [Ginsengibacter sp.]